MSKKRKKYDKRSVSFEVLEAIWTEGSPWGIICVSPDADFRDGETFRLPDTGEKFCVEEVQADGWMAVSRIEDKPKKKRKKK